MKNTGTMPNPQATQTYLSLAADWPSGGKRLAEVSSPYGFLPVTEEIIAEIVRRIVANLDPEKVLMFGSYAYGKPDADSDVDFLIVMDTDQRFAQRSVDVSQLITPRPFPVDIIVKTPGEIQAAMHKGDWFIQEIFSRGKVLYERSRKSP